MRVSEASTSPRSAIPFGAVSIRNWISSTKALYNAACSEVIVTVRISSVFSGKSSIIAVSVLSLRKIKGAVSLRRRSAMSSSWYFSMAEAKWLRKNVAEPSTPGLQKSKMERISDKRFSTGVPVSAMRCREARLRTAFDERVDAFLIACASSSTTRSHSTMPRTLKSRLIVP